jgi:anti-anti-sigma factor
VLGEVDGLDGWHSVEIHADAREEEGIVVYRWEAPLFFANAGAFRRQIRHLVRERQPRWIVVQCEAITDVDITAAGMLEQLDKELNAQGVHMAFVELRTRLQQLVQRYGLLETLDRDHFYPSIDTALAAMRAEEENPEPQS